MEAAARTAPARIVSSACPLDCPDACSLEVHVEGDRVVAIGGSRVNPVTEGYICSKVRRYPEHVHGPRRVLFPRIREGRKGEGRFRRAGWDEALDLVAGKLAGLARRGAGEAILPLSYGGSNGYLSQDTTDARLFARLGASRLARTVCAAPSGRAAKGLYGKMAGIAIPRLRATRALIVLWGVNPAVSGIHLLPHIQAAQKSGGRLVVVDPRRTRLAEQADLHLAGRARGDLPLALAVIRWLFANGARRHGVSRRARDGRRGAARAAPRAGRSIARRRLPAFRRRRSRPSRGSTPTPRPRRCAAAGASSATATAARRSRPCWRCPRWPASSACGAADTRCPTRPSGTSTCRAPRAKGPRARARST